MKALLSKEHYCYKIHTLLMKSSAYPPLIGNPPPPIWTTIEGGGFTLWIPTVMSLSFITYQVTISQAMFGILRILYICSISSYFFQPKRTKGDYLTFISVSH